MDNGQILKVMIAGIGGASLGTELLKCLQLAGRYATFGCDISATAYGMHEPGFERTYLVKSDDYVNSVIAACNDAGVSWLVPGGEQPTALLTAASAQLAKAGIRIIGNDPAVVAMCADKAKCFEQLVRLNVAVPCTTTLTDAKTEANVGRPCVIKPATGTGGSAMVFFATSDDEVHAYAEYIRRTGHTPIAQEYIGVEEGEFTVGVLSLPNGDIAGSVALRRSLDTKLSVLSRARGGVISTGYSQGYIDDFPEVRTQAEAIAMAIGSRGPINIQGRMRQGQLVPFEINPRLSASTYLRAMAGFNELDLLLQHLAFSTPVKAGPIREGWYLRSLSEHFVSP